MGAPRRRHTAATAIALLVATLAVLAVACTPIDRVDFANFTYAPDACGPVIDIPPEDGYDVVDGGVRHGDPSQADFHSVTVRPDPIAGDLTGHGLAEAALILDCSTGNRPISVGRIMTPTAPGTAVLPSVPDPPLPADARRAALASLDIDDGTLIATWVVLEVDDPACCPTGRLTTVHRWDGDRFDTSVP
jgi:hypothetical protein